MKQDWAKRLFAESYPPRQVIVAAHPDDEVIGCGAQLSRWPEAQVIHVTDGARRNEIDATGAGFRSPEEYARARHNESLEALKLAGIPGEHLHPLGFGDQESTLHLVDVTEALMQKLFELQPEFVITHPYEGGHPDHDSTAFAVHLACRILLKLKHAAPTIIEATSYFNRAGIMVTGEFLPRARTEVQTFVLTPEQQQFKRRLFDCYRTQQEVLQYFPIEMERFRLAPEYDFTQPPHAGKLYYEFFEWGTTGDRWRKLAAAAWSRLERPADTVRTARLPVSQSASGRRAAPHSAIPEAICGTSISPGNTTDSPD